ncbi:MAG: tRNA (adenosine(37)-N6)-threonylcarbamoyltransferase complex ATPase subunit type 1 TsaE [Eubacteriales bacterium]|nr:tRNA (adenosine(37)-N6)-threonylcarbamoyltransferase complex ATPase subunit type 1 TsaE [Eubacteriales bacterium]
MSHANAPHLHPVHLISESPEETEQLGISLASLLKANDIINLAGDLGAGKTALTRGIAEGIGCRRTVSSPTFTLVMEHLPTAGGLPLFHFDVYRLADSDAFLELGLDEYFERQGICVIEWGTLIEDILPLKTLKILIRMTEPEMPNRRILTLYWPDHYDELNLLERIWLDAHSGN